MYPAKIVCNLYTQSEEFKMLGKLVATSIVQEGPGLPIFLPAAYKYMSGESDYMKDLDIEAVPDPLVRNLLSQVSRWRQPHIIMCYMVLFHLVGVGAVSKCS